MKEQLKQLIERLNENQIIYTYTFLTKMFGINT